MSKLFFKTPGASNPSSHSRTFATDRNYPKSVTKLVAGTATIFTLGKQSEDSTTRKTISRPFRNMITLLQSLITWKQLGTTSNGTILTFWLPARLITTVRLRRPCLFKLQPALNANVIKKAFPLCLSIDTFRLKSLSSTADIFCLGSRLQHKYLSKNLQWLYFENVCWLAYETLS